MTAQIEDCYKHRRKRYSLVAISDEMTFDPRAYGVIPKGRCTACWRGYWCEYNVTAKGLFLQNLYINSEDEKYPPINGVNVSEIEYRDCISLSFKDGKVVQTPTKIEKHMGHREYKNLNIPVKYTGKVLLGNGFLREYYIHMGFQRSWAYTELIEFEFKDGKLINKTDHSDTAAKLREILDSSDVDPAHPDGGNIPQFVEDSFSLDYSVKAWWMDKETRLLDLTKKLGI